MNSLGEAFDIARNKEAFLQAKDLPLDFDDVIIQVRQQLDTSVRSDTRRKNFLYPDPDDPTAAITLGKFLDNSDMVHDFVTSVPSFINQQYIELRRAGYCIP